MLSPLYTLLKANDRLVYAEKDIKKIDKFLAKEEVRALLPENTKFLWGVKSNTVLGEEPVRELYPLQVERGKDALLDGEVVVDARQDLDQRGRPSVNMQMSTRGAKEWRKITQKNIGIRIAITLDDKVYSAPEIQGVIPNGNSQVTGNFSMEEATDLANILKSGSLPAPVRIIEDVVVGPSMSLQAQQHGIISIACGLAVVVLFMMLYYTRGGLVADFALLFNVFFVLGILAQLNASLTLAGIAGIVLTIGMSVDANVLIFERIREELAKKVHLRDAIAMGYKRAYSSIIDGNLTTFLTALVLYVLGKGPIKGFAITLMVGIICSFFSAVFITRLVIEWLLKKDNTGKISFKSKLIGGVSTAIAFDFIRLKKRAYALSLGIFILGAMAFFAKGGLNMGVDFLGGRSYIVRFDTPQQPSVIKTALPSYVDNKGIEVKTFGSDRTLKITTNYLVQEVSEESDKKVHAQIVGGLAAITQLTYQPNEEASTAGEFSIVGTTKVGPAVAEDVKSSSVKALIFSFIVIFLYILVRFKRWQFGLGALVAIAHDVLLVLSLLSIAHFLGVYLEIDQVVLAAMLTLVGYSINDTVVIFDRIRENIKAYPSKKLSEVMNLSLGHTISRTAITSVTTLFVVLVLLLFGGTVLRGFSFTLLVGIMLGTYSSIFIAPPIVLDMTKSNSSKKK